MAKQSSKKKTPTPLFLAVTCGAIIILALSMFNLALYSTVRINKVLGLRTEVDTKHALLKELLFWENTVSKNPTYIDGWIELAKTAFRLEDLDYAEGALNSAKSIDPNSEKIIEAEYYLKN